MRKCLRAVPEENLTTGGLREYVWCTINFKSNDKLLIGVIYRRTSSDTENNDTLFQLIKTACSSRGVTHILITGYFNMKSLDWETWGTQELNTIGTGFLETLSDCFLRPHVNFPTRQGQEPSLLPNKTYSSQTITTWPQI